LKYDIARDGYNTCVQRIAHFISKLNAFCAFDRDDRRALLRSNVHMVVSCLYVLIVNFQLSTYCRLP
jgi:hypothetical protein